MLKISAYQKVPQAGQTATAARPAGSQLSESKASALKGLSLEKGTGAAFRTELDRQLAASDKVKFSAHAQARLHSRGVTLDEGRIEAISQAIDKAQAKGARESLILTDEAAYVVSVKNRTVITAFDRENLRDGVFTAIDSAVIL